jgi:hypothetical protein
MGWVAASPECKKTIVASFTSARIAAMSMRILFDIVGFACSDVLFWSFTCMNWCLYLVIVEARTHYWMSGWALPGYVLRFRMCRCLIS